MIRDQDRSGWFGASDASMIMGNWSTKTFEKWWMQKLGLNTDRFVSTAMNAGTYYEHAVLEAVGAPRFDHQILLPELLLRVNLDGDAPGRIWECKTHKVEKAYKPTKAHVQQVNVQMYAKLMTEKVLPDAVIVAYGLEEGDYRNFFREIDRSRIHTYPVGYDAGFIQRFLGRLERLAGSLRKGEWPR